MADSPVCPESTIESANRRDFIKRAALFTAAASVGGTVLGASSKLLPESSAKSDGVSTYCNPVLIRPSCSCEFSPGCFALYGVLENSKSISGAVAITGIVEHCCVCSDYAPPCGPTAVFGEAVTGTGVVGKSCRGYGVFGIGSAPDAVPIAARGAPCQVNPLQEWQNSCGVVKSAITSNGALALGTISTQGFELRVCSPNQCGIQLRGPKTGNGAGFVFETFCPASGNGQGWQILDTGCRASQGASKLNVRNLNIPKDVLTIDGANVGINTTSPSTTLSVNGSLSAKAVSKSSSYVMAAGDFTVLANASSGPATITLPPAATQQGMIVFIKKTDSSSNAVTIAGAGTDKIEGKKSKTLNLQYDGLQLISNGSGQWFMIVNSICGAFTS